MQQVLGYIIRNKETHELAPTNRRCYDAKAAAVVGFNHAMKYALSNYHHLRGVKFKDQDEFEIVGLVAIE